MAAARGRRRPSASPAHPPPRARALADTRSGTRSRRRRSGPPRRAHGTASGPGGAREAARWGTPARGGRHGRERSPGEDRGLAGRRLRAAGDAKARIGEHRAAARGQRRAGPVGEARQEQLDASERGSGPGPEPGADAVDEDEDDRHAHVITRVRRAGATACAVARSAAAGETPDPPGGILRASARAPWPAYRPSTPTARSFDGDAVPARRGEPVAAALLAAGRPLVSRSAKYHRPRGAFCLTGSCGSCLVRRRAPEPARVPDAVRGRALGRDAERPADRGARPARRDRSRLSARPRPPPPHDLERGREPCRGRDLAAARRDRRAARSRCSRSAPPDPPWRSGSTRSSWGGPGGPRRGRGARRGGPPRPRRGRGARRGRSASLPVRPSWRAGSRLGRARRREGHRGGRRDRRAYDRAGPVARRRQPARGARRGGAPAPAPSRPPARVVVATGGHPQPPASRTAIAQACTAAAASRWPSRSTASCRRRAVVVGDGAGRTLAARLAAAGMEVRRLTGTDGSASPRPRPRVRALETAGERILCDVVAIATPPACPPPSSRASSGRRVVLVPEAGVFALRVSEDGRTGVPGLFAAGEVTGAMGARAARTGRRAGRRRGDEDHRLHLRGRARRRGPARVRRRQPRPRVGEAIHRLRNRPVPGEELASRRRPRAAPARGDARRGDALHGPSALPPVPPACSRRSIPTRCRSTRASPSSLPRRAPRRPEPRSPARADVVIVGGGIMGLALAYELTRRGRDVLVLERAYLNAGASGRNGGGVRAQWATPTMIRLARRSLELCDRFAVEMGTTSGSGAADTCSSPPPLSRWRASRRTRAAPAGGAPHARHRSRRGPRRGAAARRPRFLAASYNPDDGEALAVPVGLRRPCRGGGARIATFTRVTGFETAEKRVTAVVTDRAAVRATSWSSPPAPGRRRSRRSRWRSRTGPPATRSSSPSP